MTRFPHLLAACVLIQAPLPLHAGEPDTTCGSGIRFFPDRALVPALLAHQQEARVGVRKEAGSSRLKLDIGTSMDLIEIPAGDYGSAFAAGIDFFACALTTSSDGLRLQVDAVDGFFGGHVSFSLPHGQGAFQLRLRLLHHSAHFVDGHFDLNDGSWRNGRSPLPFTRDFGEMTASCRFNGATAGLRLYSGVSYATLVRPVELRRFATLHGIEIFTEDIPGGVAGMRTCLYAAGHLGLAGIPAWAGTTSIEAGLKFGAMYGKGLRLYASVFSGPGIFGQYYDLRTTAWGIGFAFDPW